MKPCEFYFGTPHVTLKENQTLEDVRLKVALKFGVLKPIHIHLWEHKPNGKGKELDLNYVFAKNITLSLEVDPPDSQPIPTSAPP